MQFRLTVIGLGPGHPDYILPAAIQTAKEMKYLIGSSRGLESFPMTEGQERIPLAGKIDDMLSLIQESWSKGDTGVLVSGDPGYYSLLDAIKSAWPTAQVEVIPGISSLMMGFCRVGIPWHHAVLISFHGREPEENQIRYEKEKVLGMLTDPRQSPKEIANELLRAGWPLETQIWICENLTYDHEKVACYAIKEVPEKVAGPAVWVVK